MKTKKAPQSTASAAPAVATSGTLAAGRQLSPARALALPATFTLTLLLLGLVFRRLPPVYWSFLAAVGVLTAWTGVLYVRSQAAGRQLTLATAVRKQHWVQACAQLTLILYWGWHVPIVYAWLPFIFAQLIFAYAVDSLLSWSRRETYTLGFGPFPVIFSINLFLWFRPQWFYLQFLMILIGFLAKELIRWKRDGRSAHIFNPSSFPLAFFSLALILTKSSDMTFGSVIANTLFDPPHIYLVIFLVSLPGMFLFGVARTTLPAVLTAYLIGLAYLHATGTYLFLDAFIPVPVFLGMHLIVTDPSTSPRNDLGRVVFGVLYGLAAVVLYVVLTRFGVPTFYDKLLPVPILNLSVRAIERLTTWKPSFGPAAPRLLSALSPSRLAAALSPQARGVAFAAVWTVVFLGLSAGRALGDRHPGQYLPFWKNACAAGSDRACRYASYLTDTYCHNGSGWACNEVGIEQVARGGPAREQFEKACRLGYSPGCENAARPLTAPGSLARSEPQLADLPVVLRGTKPRLRETDPSKLYALACEEGWRGACERSVAERGS